MTNILLSKTTKKIKCTVDTSLAYQIKQYNWSAVTPAKGYLHTYGCRSITIANRCHYSNQQLLHRFIMELHLNRKLNKKEFIDHINGNTLDNRITNLRVVSQSDNIRNTKKFAQYSNVYKGAYFNKSKNKYEARIRYNNKNLFLGYYTTAEEAASVYNQFCTDNLTVYRLNYIEKHPKWGTSIVRKESWQYAI